MRILHVADRLSDRGGAYTWLLGIVEALRAQHDVWLAVGQDDGAPHPCRVLVRPGFGRVASPQPAQGQPPVR